LDGLPVVSKTSHGMATKVIRLPIVDMPLAAMAPASLTRFTESVVDGCTAVS
jgi:hypothetical protein